MHPSLLITLIIGYCVRAKLVYSRYLSQMYSSSAKSVVPAIPVITPGLTESFQTPHLGIRLSVPSPPSIDLNNAVQNTPRLFLHVAGPAIELVRAGACLRAVSVLRRRRGHGGRRAGGLRLVLRARVRGRVEVPGLRVRGGVVALREALGVGGARVAAARQGASSLAVDENGSVDELHQGRRS